jgi:hypothetical protein
MFPSFEILKDLKDLKALCNGRNQQQHQQQPQPPQQQVHNQQIEKGQPEGTLGDQPHDEPNGNNDANSDDTPCCL